MLGPGDPANGGEGFSLICLYSAVILLKLRRNRLKIHLSLILELYVQLAAMRERCSLSAQ